MYVKVFNHILDSSIAENRPLRHFFIDLLLCSDRDGNVIMTNKAIGKRIGATDDEVAWGLAELQKEDPQSNHPEMGGRRIIPLEGHGYGWQIVNFKIYRDLKSDAEKRAETAERVRAFRERQKQDEPKKPRRRSSVKYPLAAEAAFVKSVENGEPPEAQDRIVTASLPERLQGNPQ